MADVTLTQVRKRFGRTEVVHAVDTRVRDGEFCVLVGPSGCGKWNGACCVFLPCFFTLVHPEELQR